MNMIARHKTTHRAKDDNIKQRLSPTHGCIRWLGIELDGCNLPRTDNTRDKTVDGYVCRPKWSYGGKGVDKVLDRIRTRRQPRPHDAISPHRDEFLGEAQGESNGLFEGEVECPDVACPVVVA
mmetsp:Transcript_28973/g.34441  ORF Transcript_28973/g.34441 Transcript_28973/m.34441 type:complete len:123 (+) Transcript_28973:569-937(+)